MSVVFSTNLGRLPRNPVKIVTEIGAIGLFPTFFFLLKDDEHVSTYPDFTASLHDGALRNLRSIFRDSAPNDTTA